MTGLVLEIYVENTAKKFQNSYATMQAVGVGSFSGTSAAATAAASAAAIRFTFIQMQT